ncbi:MAG: hypothetical protein Q9M18_00170 [Mariprofundaceae bacterium]|nr:hypothetical protein [Mariprofundaceae bacterium]
MTIHSIIAGGGHSRGITLECFPIPPKNSLSEEIPTHDEVIHILTQQQNKQDV